MNLQGYIPVVGVDCAAFVQATPKPDRPTGRPVSFHYIVDETLKALSVAQVDLVGSGRHHRIVLARSIITMLARHLTTLSFPDIAERLHRPNHSSVITAHKRIVRQIEIKVIVGPPDDRIDVAETYAKVSAKVLERHKQEQQTNKGGK